MRANKSINTLQSVGVLKILQHFFVPLTNSNESDTSNESDASFSFATCKVFFAAHLCCKICFKLSNWILALEGQVWNIRCRSWLLAFCVIRLGPGFVIYCCKLCIFLSRLSNFKCKCSHTSLSTVLRVMKMCCFVQAKFRLPLFTLHIFYTPHLPYSSFSTPSFSNLLIFHTPHFPHPSFSTLLIFHTPHFSRSSRFTLLIFHATHFPHGLIPTLFISHTLRFPHSHFPQSSFFALQIFHILYFARNIFHVRD